MQFKIFISSVQREFAKERKLLAEYIRKDAILGKFFEVFVFEEVPAQERSASDVYLREVDACDIYLGILGAEYGTTDGITVSEARGEQEGKFLFVAQKKPGLVKKGGALAGLVGGAVTVTNKRYADAKLPKSKDSLKLKFAATDVVKATGTVGGKDVSFSTTVIYCGVKGDAACGPEDVVYVAEAALIEPKSGYSRLATFTLTVGKDGKVKKKVSFSKIK